MKFSLIQAFGILLCSLILPRLESKSTLHKNIRSNSTKCVKPDTFKKKPVVISKLFVGY